MMFISKRVFLRFLIVGGLGLMFAFGTDSLSLVTAQDTQSKIAFVSERDGNAEIYTINPDGSDLTNITNNEAVDETPVWSPDGMKIAFVSDRDDTTNPAEDRTTDIFVMNPDGSDLQKITSAPESEYAPSWSPDGTKILFVRRVGERQVAIYTVNADGTGEQALTDPGTYVQSVSWSPDGERIAFTRMGRQITTNGNFGATYDGAAGLYVMNADGSDLQRLSTNHVLNAGLTWSPDSTQIALTTSLDQGSTLTFSFYQLNVETTAASVLKEDAVVSKPTWSPDGQFIAYGLSGLSIIDVVSGSEISVKSNIVTFVGMTFLTGENPAPPAWSPDGQQIVFTGKVGENLDIYIVNFDGSELRNLSDNASIDKDAVWQPKGMNQ